mmetsp:Transcript_142846/g.444234  ORF Transcript_142846/g.444234 Transcript_142846/m.444234 type:complete len:332 (-) Transcript_142846:28-1023(-)
MELSPPLAASPRLEPSQALPSPAQTPPFAAGPLLMEPCPGSPAPSTPPRRARQPCIRRVESAEKLPSPRRFRRGSFGLEGAVGPHLAAVPPPLPASAAVAPALRPQPPPLPAAAAPAPEESREQAIVDVQQMRSRAGADAKYWAQIKFAHQLLMDSTCTELALEEAAAGHRDVLDTLFREAIAGQQADRLSAVAMLRVLRQLVSELEAELARGRPAAVGAPRPEREAAAASGEESGGEEAAAKKAKRCEASMAVEAVSAPQTPPCSGKSGAAAQAATPTTPGPWTPQRRAPAAAPLPEWTPPPAPRHSRVPAAAGVELSGEGGPQKLRDLA